MSRHRRVLQLILPTRVSRRGRRMGERNVVQREFDMKITAGIRSYGHVGVIDAPGDEIRTCGVHLSVELQCAGVRSGLFGGIQRKGASTPLNRVARVAEEVGAAD